GELGMKGDVVQPLELTIEHLGEALDRLWIQQAVPNDPESSGAFGDEQGTVGQEGESVRPRQPLGGNDSDLRPRNLSASRITSRSVHSKWAVGQRTKRRSNGLLSAQRGGGNREAQRDRSGRGTLQKRAHVQHSRS